MENHSSPSSAFSDVLSKAASAIQDAHALLFTAGAGFGVDSGLPDFRGDTGFWKAYPPFAKRRLSFIDLANPRWFFQDPATAWGFYGHRLNLYRQTIPHEGFSILWAWGQKKPGGYFVYTSNVDGQFQRAGFDPDLCCECHGSIRHFQCTAPCSKALWDAPPEAINVDETTILAREPLPKCPSCGSLARPNILMFGDEGWLEERSLAQERRYLSWLQNLGGKPLAIIEAGAGTHIPSIRSLGERVLREKPNVTLIRLNPRESEGPEGTISIPLGAKEALLAIQARL